ncbi:MAG: hypothetical protein COB60_10090 [Flavobacteriaceae bacterium]|nr:MAG: hypothetical protein COB60_10090 [Flavobacteriaceae bacterium]
MKNLLVAFVLLFVHVSQANVVVLNGLTHVHKSNVGTEITGVIKLKNTKDTEQRVIIYFNDLFQPCNGETLLTGDTTHNRSLVKWLSTNVTDKVLKGNEEYELLYTISVPNDVNLSGSFWGVLMVEVEKPIREEETEYGVKLESKVRYGIQLIADLGEKEPAILDFFDIKFQDTEFGKNVLVVLENQGGFYAQPTIILEVFSLDGTTVKKVEVKFKKIYPSFCKEFLLDISGIEKGEYKAVVVADYGEDMFAIDLDLTIE